VALQAGVGAPEFGLLATPYQRVALSEFDRPVVLIFFPADWSPVCGDELTVFRLPVGCSEPVARRSWGSRSTVPGAMKPSRNSAKWPFPSLRTATPKVRSRKRTVYREDDGTSERALFVIDRDGKVAWSEVSPVGVNPGADGALRAVEALS
jgi:peroxiredoxin